MNQPVMIDMHRVSEDERIKLIAAHVHTHGRATFMVDGDRYDKGKANRYLSKLKANCPRIYEVERKVNDPVKNVTTVVIALRADG